MEYERKIRHLPPPPPDATDPALKKVSLDLENTNLYTALKLLFAHIDANYYLDPTLKNVEVSVHLNDVPFKIVLDTLVKSTGLPLTWKFDDNIYRIVPKREQWRGRAGRFRGYWQRQRLLTPNL